MGVTVIDANRNNQTDLDKAILLAIKEMLPNDLDITQVEAREFKPFHDGEKHEAHPGMVGLGTNLSDLYCVLFYDEATGRRILTPAFQKVESMARKLEARLPIISTEEEIKKEMNLFFQQTAMPFELGNYFYQKVKGTGSDLASFFKGGEIVNINNRIDLHALIYVARDYVGCKKTVLESYAGQQSIHFFFAQPEKYERIPKKILNEILLIAAQREIPETRIASSSTAYFLGNILNALTDLTDLEEIALNVCKN